MAPVLNCLFVAEWQSASGLFRFHGREKVEGRFQGVGVGRCVLSFGDMQWKTSVVNFFRRT